MKVQVVHFLASGAARWQQLRDFYFPDKVKKTKQELASNTTERKPIVPTMHQSSSGSFHSMPGTVALGMNPSLADGAKCMSASLLFLFPLFSFQTSPAQFEPASILTLCGVTAKYNRRPPARLCTDTV